MSGPSRVDPSRHLYAGHIYTPAAHSNIRLRFQAVREEQARALLAQHAPKNVATLRRKP